MGLLKLPSVGSHRWIGSSRSKISQSLPSWFNAIAHVPPILLSDSSIAENIAFGVPREHIDMDSETSCFAGSNNTLLSRVLRIMELLWVREAFV